MGGVSYEISKTNTNNLKIHLPKDIKVTQFMNKVIEMMRNRGFKIKKRNVKRFVFHASV